MPSPHMPTKYLGPNVFYPSTVTRNRRPTSTDVFQPETGKYYIVSGLWQVGKQPTTGVEGEIYVLTKIVANVAYWELITGGATAGTVVGLRDSSGDIVGPDATGIIDVIGDTNSIITTNVDGVLPFTLRVNIKAGEKNASSAAGKAGVVSVNSAQFDIDANGWITLAGGTGPAANSFTTDLNSPVVSLAGVLALTGSTTTYTNGSVANTVRTEVQGTNHALFVGSGANTPAANLTVGTDGQVLIGATGANPAFATLTSSDSSITFTPGANTLDLKVSTLPFFNAFLSSSVANVTGDSTAYTIICDTEVSDIGSDYDNTTGKFTAPVDGVYHFDYAAAVNNMGAAHTNGRYFFKIVNAGVTQQLIGIGENNPYATASNANINQVAGSATVFMTAGWTAEVRLVVSGGTLTVGVNGGAVNSEPKCSFSGYGVSVA